MTRGGRSQEGVGPLTRGGRIPGRGGACEPRLLQAGELAGPVRSRDTGARGPPHPSTGALNPRAAQRLGGGGDRIRRRPAPPRADTAGRGPPGGCPRRDAQGGRWLRGGSRSPARCPQVATAFGWGGVPAWRWPGGGGGRGRGRRGRQGRVCLTRRSPKPVVPVRDGHDVAAQTPRSSAGRAWLGAGGRRGHVRDPVSGDPAPEAVLNPARAPRGHEEKMKK